MITDFSITKKKEKSIENKNLQIFNKIISDVLFLFVEFMIY